MAKHDESELLAVRERAMTSGIEGSQELWLRLKELAQYALVESFDASHLGAGPAE